MNQDAVRSYHGAHGFAKLAVWSGLGALLVALVVSLTLEHAHHDALRGWLAAAAARADGSEVDALWWLIGDLGHGQTFPLLLAAVLVVGGSRRRLQDALFALLLAGIVANVIKLLVMRERPTESTSFAWPSGHSAAAAALAAALSGWRPSITVAGWLGAVGVAVSRVLRGRHWPGDVCGGLLVGGLCGFAVRRLPTLLPAWLERDGVRLAIAWSAVAAWFTWLFLTPSQREIEVLINAVPTAACGLWAAARTGELLPQRHGRWQLPVGAAVVFLVVLTIGHAGSGLFALLDVDEPRFAAASRTMLRTGDWVVPWFNGVERFDKPILIYWLQAAAMALFGATEAAARLPSALGVALAAVATVGLGRLLGLGLLPALLAGFVVGSAPLAQGLAHGATADALLYGLVTAVAWVQVWRWRRPGGRVSWWLLWTGVAAAFLTKGPPALVGPLAVALGLFWAGARPRWSTTLLGIAFATALVLAWAVPALVRTDGGFWTRGVGYHVVERSLRPFEGHGGFAPWWLLTYFATIPLTMLPWSLFLPWAASALRRGEPQQVASAGPQAPPPRATARVLLAWFLGVVGTFTVVVSKLPHYVLPCYPAVTLAILLGLPAAGALLPRTAWACRALGVLVAAALPVALHLAGLRGAVVAGVVAGLCFAVTMWMGARWLARGRILPAVTGIAVGLAVSMATLFGRGLPLANCHMLASAFGSELRAAVLPGETVHLYHFVAPSVTYYLDAVTPDVKDPARAIELLARPGQLLLLRARDRDELLERARSAAEPAAAAAAAALDKPLWSARGFHPTKGREVEVFLCGARDA